MRARPENSKYRLAQNESKRLMRMDKSVLVAVMSFKLEDCIFACYIDPCATAT
jgi:hypothetical protein